MQRVTIVLLALAFSAPAFPEDLILWGCSQGSERRNVLYLADRGSGSYVKVGAQRVNARLTEDETERRWTFGPNHISLKPDGLAEYYESGTLKGSFRCRRLDSG